MPTPAVISVNPKDAPRSELSNTARDEEEIRTWWCRPFVVRAGDQWEVHALDGGESDSTTWHGLFETSKPGLLTPPSCMRSIGRTDQAATFLYLFLTKKPARGSS